MSRVVSYLFAFLALSLASTARAQLTASGAEIVSAPIDGKPFQGVTDGISASPNAEVVVFDSTSSQLVANDTNNQIDVFISRAGQVSLGSISTSGGFPSQPSTNPSVSQSLQNGTFGIVFESLAGPDLVSGYDGVGRQVFLRVIGPNIDKTVLVSRAFNFDTGQGEPLKGANAVSTDPKVALIPGRPNKFAVAFLSRSSNLFKDQPEPDSTGARLNPALAMITLSSSEVTVDEIRGPGESFNSDASDISISGNGQALAFSTAATNVLREPIGCGPSGFCPQQVYVFQPFKSGTPGAELLSFVVGSTGQRLPGNGNSTRPSISFDASVAAFISDAPDFGSTGRKLVVARERSKQSFDIISKSFNSDPALEQLSNGEVFDAQISPNGLYVGFSDDSSNLTTDSANNTRLRTQVYLKNRTSREISMLSKSTSGAVGDFSSSRVALGARGFGSLEVFAAFRSQARNFGTETISFTQTAVYKNDLRFPAPRLTDNLPISVPPDVRVVGKKVIIKLQKFRAPAQASHVNPLASSVTYRVTTRSAGTNYRTITTTTRNQVTMANLSPGRYTVSYRVTSGTGSSRTRSQTSSRATFVVR